MPSPKPTAFQFTLEHCDSATQARAGRWSTPHGAIETPAFMPVGTIGSVKGLTPDQLREARVQMVLANTYHLALRPGADVVADLGGLHRFMAWDGPILTDSGGFQVFSLARLSRLDDEQVVFRSHIDGSLLELSPERAIRIQGQLGADCIMCLDECPPHDVPERIVRAVGRLRPIDPRPVGHLEEGVLEQIRLELGAVDHQVLPLEGGVEPEEAPGERIQRVERVQLRVFLIAVAARVVEAAGNPRLELYFLESIPGLDGRHGGVNTAFLAAEHAGSGHW